MVRAYSLAASTVALLSITASVSANQKPYGEYESITQDRLRAHLTFIASDLLEGRDTPSRGLDIAAEYIATQMKLYGVEPAGENGTYFQTMWWGRSVFSTEGSSISVGGETLELGEDVLPTVLAPIDADAEVVFVPSGWSHAEKGVDPYRGLNVRGKIVVTDGVAPEGVDRRELFSEWTRVGDAAKAAGAVAVLQVGQRTNGWERTLERLTAGGRFAPVSGDADAIPTLTITPEAIQGLYSADIGDAGPNELRGATLKPGAKIALTLNVQQERQKAYNVIAVVPGTDPVLKNEYVAVGCHYDHVGIGRADESGDTIYNGADDDGSGTVAMIEMARAMKANPPKRSTLFVWHCGEEKGLLGSQFFVENATVDVKQIKWLANIDMIGMAKQPGDTNPRNAGLAPKGEVYVIGPKTISSTMDGILRSVNAEVHNLRLNDKHDTLEDPERIFFRSDHISYVRVGVPAIFIFSGAHEHYHRPSDEVDKLDFEQYLKNTHTIFAMTYHMGNIAKTPVIDKVIPGITGN